MINKLVSLLSKVGDKNKDSHIVRRALGRYKYPSNFKEFITYLKLRIHG